jgi:site-specific DNA recombinase
MEHYVGLDVGLEETSVCVVDKEGQSVREIKVATEPEVIRSALAGFADRLGRVGIEASSLGMWLYRELQPTGLPVIIVEARHMRVSMSTNTGKRVSRPNPEAKWVRTEVPELRIVDDELWQRVKLRQAELAKQFEATTNGVRAARAERLNRLPRPAFLLSGLLTCGCCGGKYGIVVNDRYGCLGHFRKGISDNGRTVRRDDIERRVLAGLTDKLVSPEAVAVAVRAYAEETNRQNHERRAHAETSRRALEKIERSIKGILDAIEDGMYQPAMKARMGELQQQKAEIEAWLAEAPADLPDIHPNIAEHYRAKVIHLAETLAGSESNGEAREDIRSLVGEVVITPGDKRGESHAILRGELMAILDLATGCRRSPPARSYNKRACRSPQPLLL